MDKPYITLFENVGTGVIVEFPTGVIYSNQAGGTANLHPTLEGAFVPFGNDVLMPAREFVSLESYLVAHFEGPKYRGSGATGGLDAEDAELVDEVLQQARMGHCLRTDRERLGESCEAWVWLTVLSDEGSAHTSIFSGFGPYPRRGVLTWCNSD